MRAPSRVGGITRCKRLVTGAYILQGDSWFETLKKNANKKVETPGHCQLLAEVAAVLRPCFLLFKKVHKTLPLSAQDCAHVCLCVCVFGHVCVLGALIFHLWSRNTEVQ